MTVGIPVREEIENVENKTATSNKAYQNIKDLFDLSELNDLPSFADEIRTQIAYSIRSLSVSIWNKHNDIKCALAVINLAIQINVDKNVKDKFIQDHTELSELEIKLKDLFVCYFCDTNAPDEGSNYEITLYKITSRDYLAVKYQYLPINIPRCPACKSYHGIEFHHEAV